MKIELSKNEIMNICWAVGCFIFDTEYKKKLNRPSITDKDLTDLKDLRRRFNKIDTNNINKIDIDLSEDELGAIYNSVLFVIEDMERDHFNYLDLTDEDINDLDELEDKFYNLLDKFYEEEEKNEK